MTGVQTCALPIYKVIQTVLAIPLPKEKSGTEAKNGNEMNEKTDRKK